LADESLDTFENSLFSSIRWNLILSFGGQLTGVAFTLMLSRLLEPSDFGIMTATMAFVGLIEAFGSMGSTSALTQRQVLSGRFYSAVLLIAGASAILMMLIVWLSSPYIASFYRSPDLESALFLLSLTIPLQFLETFPLAELQRRLLFDKIAVSSFFRIIISGVVAVYLAYTGNGWVALVVRLLLAQAVRTFYFCFIAWPKFKFDPAIKEIKELVNYGVPQSMSQFMLLFGRRIDEILIGKWMGTGTLGIYSLAYSLYMWPISNIKGRISQVVFAALSKVQKDPAAMSHHYLKVVSLATLIGFPIIFGFASVCDLAVPIVMGEKWLPAIPVLRILGIASLFEICVFQGAIFQAAGRTKTYLKTITITRIIAVAGIVVGLNFGLKGVAESVVVTSFISFFIYNYLVRKLIPLTNIAILTAIIKNAFPAIAMLFLVLLFRFTLADYFAPVCQLAISILIGVTFYGAFIKKFHPELFTRQDLTK
jgi:PST family polysaccharide transporter